MYVSEIVSSNSRGRSLGRCKDRVKEYLCERGLGKRFKQESGEWIGRVGCHYAMPTRFVDIPEGGARCLSCR